MIWLLLEFNEYNFLLVGRTNGKRKRSSEDSFSSDSSIADSNQNKKSRGTEKYGNHNNPREAINRNSEFLNENGEEEIEKVQNTVNGQSDAGKRIIVFSKILAYYPIYVDIFIIC